MTFEVNLAELAILAAQWEHVAVKYRASAAAWQPFTANPRTAAFALRAITTLTGHADVAAAAAERLRDCRAQIQSTESRNVENIQRAVARPNQILQMSDSSRLGL